MRISVVLPTHNRPELLQQAVQSVKRQTWSDWELVVVDDGSMPAVQAHPDLGIDRPAQWIRSTQAEGPAAARNRGIMAATGDIVTFLDDDDLLASDVLETIANAFQRDPYLDCLFINISPFGAAANGMRDNQTQALNGMLARMGLSGRDETILPLGDNLFEAMLGGLPLAFQRVAIRRTALQRVGTQQPGSMGFGDLEWPFRIALRCQCSVALSPLYRVRCDGQSFFTRAEAKGKLADAVIRVNQQLSTLPEVACQRRRAALVRVALAKSRFDKAHFSYKTGGNFPWREFYLSAIANFGWPHLSLLTKLCFEKALGRKTADRGGQR